MFEPMLAKVYLDFMERIVFPVAIQPKLNGVRMTSSPSGVGSRTGKPLRYSPELEKDLHTLRKLHLDGELYLHGYHLDQIRGNAKRLVSPKLDLDLQFHIFDLGVYGHCFEHRMRELLKIQETDHIKVVPTFLANSVAEIEDWLDILVGEGYEGVMIRNLQSYYQHTRTKDLLKYKPWIYTKARIMGFKEGLGKYRGMLGALKVTNGAWTCFPGSGFVDSQRAGFWINRKNLLGQLIEMKYLELTSLGNPHSPIFVGLRKG